MRFGVECREQDEHGRWPIVKTYWHASEAERDDRLRRCAHEGYAVRNVRLSLVYPVEAGDGPMCAWCDGHVTVHDSGRRLCDNPACVASKHATPEYVEQTRQRWAREALDRAQAERDRRARELAQPLISRARVAEQLAKQPPVAPPLDVRALAQRVAERINPPTADPLPGMWEEADLTGGETDLP